MFGKKSPSHAEHSKNYPSDASSHNSLVEGSILEGSCTTKNDYRIDGEYSGELTCEAKVIVGKSGIFKGTIRCQNAIIEGSFDGHLHVQQELVVKSTASVFGEIHTDKLQVESGSTFEVACHMKEPNTTEKTKTQKAPITEKAPS